jgi:hypothetical protein
MRDKPAVVYPASGVDSDVVRADMESASPKRQSIQAAGVQLPAELSASSGVGASRVAMMGDQSPCKGGWVKRRSIHSSSWHRIGGARDLFVHSRDRAGVRLAVTQRRIADARQLVGQRAGCLVVVRSSLDIERPVPQVIDLFAGGMRDAGRTQDRAGAVGKQHAQVAVAALGNAPQVATTARGIFLRRQAEPAGEVARILEVRDIAAGGGDHGGGGQQADAGDRQQCRAGRRLFGQRGQIAFELRDARFEQADLFDEQLHGAADQGRHSRVRICQHPADLFNAVATASRNGNTEFAAKPSQRIDARSARAHPQRARAVQALQRLLLDGLDLDRRDIGAAGRFEQGAGIGGIGLVALDVGADVGGRQELDVDAQGIELACPVMGRAAGFHDDERDVAVDEPALELAARETVLLDDTPGGIGDGELEDGLGKIDGYGSSMHGGLLLLTDPRPHVDQCAYFRAKRQGESIPSFKPDSTMMPLIRPFQR